MEDIFNWTPVGVVKFVFAIINILYIVLGQLEPYSFVIRPSKYRYVCIAFGSGEEERATPSCARKTTLHVVRTY